MPLPSSGPISMSQINVELNFPATSLISLNTVGVRNLAGVPSGAISLANFYGKSNAIDKFIAFSGQNGAAGRHGILTDFPTETAVRADNLARVIQTSNFSNYIDSTWGFGGKFVNPYINGQGYPWGPYAARGLRYTFSTATYSESAVFSPEFLLFQAQHTIPSGTAAYIGGGELQGTDIPWPNGSKLPYVPTPVIPLLPRFQTQSKFIFSTTTALAQTPHNPGLPNFTQSRTRTAIGNNKGYHFAYTPTSPFALRVDFATDTRSNFTFGPAAPTSGVGTFRRSSQGTSYLFGGAPPGNVGLAYTGRFNTSTETITTLATPPLADLPFVSGSNQNIGISLGRVGDPDQPFALGTGRRRKYTYATETASAIPAGTVAPLIGTPPFGTTSDPSNVGNLNNDVMAGQPGSLQL